MARRHNGEGSIYPYRNGYAAHVWITTPGGRRQRKSVYGKTRDEVHAKWLKLHEQARRGPVVSRSPILATYLEGWLTDVVRPGIAPATVANYDLFVRLYIVPDLGHRKLEKLTVRDVQVWLNQLRARCQCCAQGKDASRDVPRCCGAEKCCRQVASEWTVHQAWTVLRSALSAAMREELVTRNVAALVRVPVPRSRRTPVWSVDEARKFLESARSDDDPLYVGYVLMLVLGLRRGELLGLAWEDVDLTRHEASIRWQVQRVKGELLRRPTKTKTSEAPLPLPAICVHALDQRRVTEARWRLAAGEAWAGSGLVLTTQLGDPLDPRNFHRYFKGRAEKAGVPVISVHSTRRTCASLLVALDVHPRVAMAILRHSQIAVTMDIYSQVSSASTREALKRLGSQLGEVTA
jgi:integrase